jgi:uncharacterized protein
MILPITLAAAGAAALINVWLAIRVGRVRTKEKVMVGDGGNDAVVRRMRAHANFVEYTPFVLILIGLIELATGTSTWLWIVMAVYMAGRVAHGFGMDGIMAARGAGTGITLLTLLGLGLYAVAIPYLTVDEPQAPTQIELQSAEEVPQG